MTELRRGTAFGAAAYLIWGLFPLYFPLLEPAGAFEIMSHRIVWSLVVVAGLLAVTRNWAWVRPLLSDRRTLAAMTAAAVLIAANWALYIWAVNSEHVVETSLGYFITPVALVLIGVVVLHEHRGLDRQGLHGAHGGADPLLDQPVRRERRGQTEREGHRVERCVERAERRRLGDLPEL